MNLPNYPSLAEAYMAVLSLLQQNGVRTDPITDPTSVGSLFGDRQRTTLEIIGAAFTLRNPRDRIVHSSIRPFNLQFAIANTLWTLSGSDSLEPIQHYNARGKLFSSDGVTLEGAMGARIFSSHDAQFDRVLDLLGSHRTSRRAMIQVFLPVDLQGLPRDTPCATGLHYLVRKNQLHSVTFMRSQNAARLLTYDVFLFSMIQEYLAGLLDVELGTYTHMVSSLHYYDDEEDLVKNLLAEPCSSPGPMERMPRTTKEEMAKIHAAEMAIRTRGGSPQSEAIAEYWARLLTLLAVEPAPGE